MGACALCIHHERVRDSHNLPVDGRERFLCPWSYGAEYLSRVGEGLVYWLLSIVVDSGDPGDSGHSGDSGDPRDGSSYAGFFARNTS